MVKKAANYKFSLLYILIALLTVWLFRGAFASYFFQDDWFSLKISQAANAADIIRFFWPRSSVIYYRPLGMQLPFFIFSAVFGLNVLPFRLLTLLVHFLNGWLVYKLIYWFVKNRQAALMSAFLYLTSAVHMTVFYWAATFAFVMGPAFYFAGFYAYITERRRLSLGLFVLGLFTNELLLTLPAVLGVFLIARKRTRDVKNLWPEALLMLVYVFFRLTIATFPTSGGYALLTDIRQFAFNLRNYVFWSFNWPEEIHSQFVSFLVLNPEFVRGFWKYLLVFGLNMFLAGGGTVALLWWGIRQEIIRDLNWLIFGIIWFPLTLMPVLYFAKHYYAYYLPIPMFGCLLITAIGITAFLRRFPGYRRWVIAGILLACTVWYISAGENLRLNSYIHWVPLRAARSAKLVGFLKNNYPAPADGTEFIFVESGNNDEIKWALNEGSALSIIYPGKDIRATFVHKNELPENLLLEKTTTDRSIIVANP